MKKIFKTSAFLLVSIFGFLSTFQAREIPLSAYQDSNTQWYMLRDKGYFITFDYFLEHARELLGLSPQDGFRIKERNADFFIDNVEHIRLKQTYGGYEVEDAILLVHLIHDTVDYINADLVYGIESTPLGMQLRGRARALSEGEAREKAFSSLGITPPTEEQMEKARQGRATRSISGNISEEEISDTLVPNLNAAGQLLIARKSGMAIEKESYTFAWKYALLNNAMDSAFYILIDANNGEVADISNATNNLKHGLGSVRTLYYGEFIKDMTTSQCDFCINAWRLEIGSKLKTYLNGQMLTDADNVWNAPAEQPATTAHWAGEKIWNFWSNYYGRNSYDNQGSMLTINAGISGMDNASWYNGLISLGYRPSTGKWYSAIDIIGHEFMHGILYSIVGGYPDLSSSVDDLNEQGAIREGLCDIMGKRAEYEIYKDKRWRSNHEIASDDSFWVFGDKLGGEGIRRMNTPEYSSYNSPSNSVYRPYEWKAYDNAGILDRWFVLLSDTIDNIANAADIVYFALRDRATNSTNFTKFKDITIAQAQKGYNLGLPCNSVAKRVLAAWKKVGVAKPNEVLPGCFDNPTPGGGGTVIGFSNAPANEKDVLVNGLKTTTDFNLLNAANSEDRGKTGLANEEIRIYPIPAQDFLSIRIPLNLLGYRCRISSMQGVKLLENTLSDISSTIDVSALEAGTYILSVYRGTDLSYTQRIVIL